MAISNDTPDFLAELVHRANENKDPGVDARISLAMDFIIDDETGHVIARYTNPDGSKSIYGAKQILPLFKAVLMSYAMGIPSQHVARYNARFAIERDAVAVEPIGNFGYVYLVKSSTGFYKIGRSRDPKSRIGTMHVALPFEIEIEHLIECEDYTEAEILLHNEFAKKRIRGEWFALDESDVNEIKHIKRIKKGGMVESTVFDNLPPHIAKLLCKDNTQ